MQSHYNIFQKNDSCIELSGRSKFISERMKKDEIEPRMSNLTAMQIDEDDTKLAVASKDGKITFIHPDSGLVTQELMYEDSQSTSMKWMKQEKRGMFSHLLTISRCNGLIQQYDYLNKEVVHTANYFKLNDIQISQMDYSSDNSQFMVGSGSGADTYMVDSETMEITSVFIKDSMKVHNSGKITCVKAHQQDPNLFVVGNSNHSILLYDTRMNGAFKKFGGPNVMSNSIDIFGDVIVAGSYRNNAQIELFSFGSQIQLDDFQFGSSHRGDSGYLFATCFSNDGKQILAGGAGQNELKIFHNDLLSTQKYHSELSLYSFQDAVTHIQTSKDTKRIFVGLQNGDIHSMRYKVVNESHYDDEFTLDDVIQVAKAKENEMDKKRREIFKSLSPFDHCYYMS